MSNIIEQAYADMEARRQETVAPHEGGMLPQEHPPADNEPVTAVLPPKRLPPMAVPGKKTSVAPGLSGRAFGAALAADMPERRVEFTVSDYAGYVTLRKMASGDQEEFLRLIGDVADEEGQRTPAKALAAMRFLVARTVRGGVIPQRAGSAEWQAFELSRNDREREQQLQGLNLSPDFAEALLAECLTQNDMGEGQQGN